MRLLPLRDDIRKAVARVDMTFCIGGIVRSTNPSNPGQSDRDKQGGQPGQGQPGQGGRQGGGNQPGRTPGQQDKDYEQGGRQGGQDR